MSNIHLDPAQSKFSSNIWVTHQLLPAFCLGNLLIDDFASCTHKDARRNLQKQAKPHKARPSAGMPQRAPERLQRSGTRFQGGGRKR